jgi:hypothetical protein
MEEPGYRPPQFKFKRRKRLPKWALPLAVVAILVISAVLITLIVADRSDGNKYASNSQNPSQFPSALRTAAKNSDFPVYYPTDLPTGFMLSEDSIGSNGGIVYYNFSYGNDDKLVITQQAKPTLTEEVIKTYEFNTSLGKAYIANLNGNTAGFVIANNTLVILNTSDKIETNDLQQIMVGLQKVN